MEQTGKIIQIGYLRWTKLDVVGMGSNVIQIMLLLNCLFSFPFFSFFFFSFLFFSFPFFSFSFSFSFLFLFFSFLFFSFFIQYSDFSGGCLIMDWRGHSHLS